MLIFFHFFPSSHAQFAPDSYAGKFSRYREPLAIRRYAFLASAIRTVEEILQEERVGEMTRFTASRCSRKNAPSPHNHILLLYFIYTRALFSKRSEICFACGAFIYSRYPRHTRQIRIRTSFNTRLSIPASRDIIYEPI